MKKLHVGAYIWLMYVSLLGVMLGFLCRPDVSDFYYIRYITGPIATFLYTSDYFIVGSIFLMLLMLFGAKSRNLQIDLPGFALVCFLLFRFTLASRRISAGFPMQYELITFSLLFVLIIIFSQKFKVLDDSRIRGIDWISKFMVIELFGYLLVNWYLDITQPTSVNNSGRFHGLSNHSNEFSISLSLLTAWAYMAIFSNKSLLRILSIITIGISAYFVYRSGSRSGALTFLVVSLPFMYWTIRYRAQWIITSVFALVLVLPFGWVYFKLGIEDVASSRLGFTVNTRAVVFEQMWNNFLNNPLIGNPLTVGGTSNSFLYAASSSGIIGLIFLLISLLSLGLYSWKLHKLVMHPMMPTSLRLLQPFLWSVFGAIMVSSAFSGYFVETMQFPLLFTLFHMAFVSKTLNSVEFQIQQTQLFRRTLKGSV